MSESGSPPAIKSQRWRWLAGAAIAAAVGASILILRGRFKEGPLEVKAVRAFPNLHLRYPLVITGAGDGTDRIFVCTGQGTIHVFTNNQRVADTSLFLDIEEKVVCEGEMGLLGLAFHPNFRHNGEFFIFYSSADATNTSVISRFRVSASDPDAADPASEEEILRLERPTGRHNGGALAFGPDGYLYVAVGDGGTLRDSQGNAQNLNTLLGAILRIDVDRQDDGRNYAIPQDNPFVGRADARPEIWAYGLRNVWRMSFDRATGRLWAGDVGEETWEEIDIIQRGGNYGWNLREGKHQFGLNGAGPRSDLIEPVWEYHHDVGMCVTGGLVYRGKKFPELQGRYFFADYVASKVWSLEYDEQANRVRAVQPMTGIENMPIVTFGEDDQGELYFADLFGRIYMLQPL